MRLDGVTVWGVIGLAISAVLIGCVGVGIESGRYLQLRDATNGTVLAQFTFLNSQDCADVLRQPGFVSGGGAAGPGKASCRPASAGHELPFRATVRERAAEVLLDVEMRSKDLCTGFVYNLLKMPGRPFDVVSECKVKDGATPVPERRALAIAWDGKPDLRTGTVTITQNGMSGQITAPLPGGNGGCNGMYEGAASGTGTWAVSCTNGLTAAGSFRALGQGKGSVGTGSDNRGRRVEFRMGGSP